MDVITVLRLNLIHVGKRVPGGQVAPTSVALLLTWFNFNPSMDK